MEVATPPCPEPQARKAKLKRRLKRMEGLSRHAVEVVVGRGGGGGDAPPTISQQEK